MKASAKRTAYYHYPVELVWKAIGAGNQRAVDPLTEDQFDNTEPAPNTIFTKSLEFVPNEVFSIQMKSRTLLSVMRLELKQVGPCETKVVFSEQVEYRTTGAYLMSRFGLAVRQDLKSFAVEIHKRLEKNQ